MKNRFFLFFLSVLFASFSFAQDGPGFDNVSEAGEMAKRILQASGKKANFQIREAKVPNAMAVLSNGKRFVLYNPDFIEKLTKFTGTEWAAVSVLAHEIGHHLNTHTSNGKLIPMSSELEADEFSGYVLRKMGASLEDAQAAMKTLASSRATATHPGRDDRLSSIQTGWERADGDRNSVAIINQPKIKAAEADQKVSQPTTRAVIDSRYILADIEFNADREASYHVTTRRNVVKVKNNQVYVIGKMTRLDNKEYPFMIYDENENKVYVGSDGTIVNSRGSTVGKLSAPRS